VTGNTFYSLEKMPDGRSGGATQAETRVYNERLVISLIRRHGQLSKADLTRLTGLAPQTLTTIVNRAAEGGLLIRLKPVRGRLGQPSVPFALNPDAAYAFGLKIGHRSADVALVDFVGEIIAVERTGFDYPTPREVMAFAEAAIGRMRLGNKRIPKHRVAGLGIASPFYHWRWDEDRADARDRLALWREIDIRAELDHAFEWPVFLFNDAAVSASAELMFRPAIGRPDFLYAYIGDQVGGAVVLDHHLFPGRNNLAGGLGETPMPEADANGEPTLTQRISLRALAAMTGGSKSRIWTDEDSWDGISGVAKWIDCVAEGLAYAARNAVALLDVDSFVIDGAMPPAVRREVVRNTRRRLARAFASRPEPVTVLEGAFGHLGPVIGGASIPLLVKFSNDKELLFKE
jgi:predicted NBD/HSP70 family sugar kinase